MASSCSHSRSDRIRGAFEGVAVMADEDIGIGFGGGLPGIASVAAAELTTGVPFAWSWIGVAGIGFFGALITILYALKRGRT